MPGHRRLWVGSVAVGGTRMGVEDVVRFQTSEWKRDGAHVSTLEGMKRSPIMSQQRPIAPNENAALAYKFWLARRFRDGSPEEDLFRAVCANSIKSDSTKVKSELRGRSSKRGD